MFQVRCLCIAFTIAVLFAWAGFGQSLDAQEAHDWKQRFTKEAPGKWQEYRDFAGRLQGTRDVEARELGATGLWQRDGRAVGIYDKRRVEYKQCGSWTLCVLYEKAPSNRKSDARVVNSKYGFMLKKLSEDRDWALSELTLEIQNAGKLVKERKDYLLNDLCSLLFLNAELISALVKDPQFKVKSATSEVSEGRNLVRIEFSRQSGVVTQERSPIQGWVLLDPDQSWVIKECEYDVELPGAQHAKVRFENKYKATSEGLPIPLMHLKRAKYSDAEGSSESETEHKFNLFQREFVPEHEFSLSAFGLPEPKGKEISQPATRWYIWLTLAAVLVACGAMLFLKLKGRYTRPEPYTNPQGSTR